MTRERDWSDAYGVSILEPVVDARRGEAEGSEKPEHPEAPEGGVSTAAGRDSIGIAFADPQFAAGRLLQFTKAARVVGVRVRVEQHFDVPDVESELADAGDDQWSGLGIP